MTKLTINQSGKIQINYNLTERLYIIHINCTLCTIIGCIYFLNSILIFTHKPFND